ncbi:MAG: cob(I)yrinic acid a,c-diamide adenosyltransferase [bacterium]|nr:cob(I)yrinic acid a,c-diamide adenosyltransferase [bacterium]
MLYTRKGDDGTSGLLGTKERFPKNSPVYDALGTLDELNSLLGVCRACSVREKGGVDVSDEIQNVQERLFIIQAELAGAPKSILLEHIKELESTIEKFEKLIANPHAFVISGTTELSAMLDYARAVSRRAERKVLGAQTTRKVSAPTRTYLNRLSSLLYALARYAASTKGTKESSPSYL